MEKRKKDIEAYGMKARGRKELIRHLEGWPLQRSQAIMAKCYDCMGYYSDGKFDCFIPACPLHGFMPYKGRAGNGNMPFNVLVALPEAPGGNNRPRVV